MVSSLIVSLGQNDQAPPVDDSLEREAVAGVVRLALLVEISRCFAKPWIETILRIWWTWWWCMAGHQA